MIKAELRKRYLSRQNGLSQSDRIKQSGKIAARFFENFDLAHIRFLHCFIPIEKFNEIDTRIIFMSLWNEFPSVQTCVPRVDFQTQEIVNLKFDRDTQLQKNVWNIEEPVHDDVVDPQKMDMVLVPGLCFDLTGHRVGYGKGFYDRFLGNCRPDCTKVGLSYFDPIDRIEDSHDGDVQLDFVATPDAVYRSSTSA